MTKNGYTHCKMDSGNGRSIFLRTMFARCYRKCKTSSPDCDILKLILTGLLPTAFEIAWDEPQAEPFFVGYAISQI